MSIEKLTQEEGSSMDIVKENIDKLKEIFPDVFTEGKVDFDALQATLGEYLETGEERYSFNWHGKAQARRIAQTPSTGTLRPCPEESIDWDSTQNLFIEGDNLEVLKLLQKSYHRKVKMIYIDPPYNTGKEFIYPDKFQENLDTYLKYTGQKDDEGHKFSPNTETTGRYHTNWLNMMYPRLKLARNLLKDDGIIFISIDDNELFNLSKLCNEVFGEENFVSLLSVENNPKGRKNSKFVSVSNDYCLIYAREKESSCFVENIPKNINDMTLDEDGNYIHGSGKRVLVGENSFNKGVSGQASEKHYSVYYNKECRDLRIIKENSLTDVNQDYIADGYVRYVSHRNGVFIENTYTHVKLTQLFSEKALEFKEDKIFEKNFSSSIRMKSMLVNREYDALVNNESHKFKIDVKTTSAGTYLKELFDSSNPIFTSPKNIGLITLLATLFDGKDYLILDFFAGSATVADAVMQLNHEDEGNRKYILTQLPEPCDEKSEAKKAGYATIAEIGKERIRRAAAKIKEENPGYDGDLGFKVLKLDSSNIKPWDADFDNIQRSLEDSVSNIKSERSEEDVLYEILLKYGLDLTLPIETRMIESKKVFSIGLGALVICLDSNITLDVVEGIGKLKAELEPEVMRVVFKDNGFKDDVVKTNAIQILKRYDIEDVKSL